MLVSTTFNTQSINWGQQLILLYSALRNILLIVLSHYSPRLKHMRAHKTVSSLFGRYHITSLWLEVLQRHGLASLVHCQRLNVGVEHAQIVWCDIKVQVRQSKEHGPINGGIACPG
jgi:hypothetical protein